MKSKILNILISVVIISMLITACGAPATARACARNPGACGNRSARDGSAWRLP